MLCTTSGNDAAVKARNDETSNREASQAADNIQIDPILLQDKAGTLSASACPVERSLSSKPCVKAKNPAGHIVYWYVREDGTGILSAQDMAACQPKHDCFGEEGEHDAGAADTSDDKHKPSKYPLPPTQCYNYSTQAVPESEFLKPPQDDN